MRTNEETITRLEEATDLTLLGGSTSASSGVTSLGSHAFELASVLGTSSAGSQSTDVMLRVITEQRDRHKRKCYELQEVFFVEPIMLSTLFSQGLSLLQELKHTSDLLAASRVEVERLTADNVRFYEKVRFLQSYKVSMLPS